MLFFLFQVLCTDVVEWCYTDPYLFGKDTYFRTLYRQLFLGLNEGLKEGRSQKQINNHMEKTIDMIEIMTKKFIYIHFGNVGRQILTNNGNRKTFHIPFRQKKPTSSNSRKLWRVHFCRSGYAESNGSHQKKIVSILNALEAPEEKKIIIG